MNNDNIEKLMEIAKKYGLFDELNFEEGFEKACLAGAPSLTEFLELWERGVFKFDLKYFMEKTIQEISIEEEYINYNRVGTLECLLKADVDYGAELYQKCFIYACSHR